MYIPPLFSALRQSFAAGYTLNSLRGDISAGLTVGIIAIPLAMALAIAVGVPPQHGLYTVLIGGSVIALTGGSRFNVSGPTAAFVVILLPITQQFGVGGLLLCTAMAGVILIAMGVLRAGALLQFIPYPVTLGFTAGIGIVIATLQIKDAFGLSNIEPAANYVEQIGALAHAMPSIQLGDTLVAAITLLVLIIWPRFVPKIPGHLVALAIGSFIGLALNNADISVATIGDRFSYDVDGVSHPGIPPFLPSFMWPWEFSGPSGAPLVLSFESPLLLQLRCSARLSHCSVPSYQTAWQAPSLIQTVSCWVKVLVIFLLQCLVELPPQQPLLEAQLTFEPALSHPLQPLFMPV